MRLYSRLLILLFSASFILLPSCSKIEGSAVNDAEDLIEGSGEDLSQLNSYERQLVGTFSEYPANDPDVWHYVFNADKTGRIYVTEGEETTDLYKIKWAATKTRLSLTRLYLDTELETVVYDYTLVDNLLTFNGISYRRQR